MEKTVNRILRLMVSLAAVLGISGWIQNDEMALSFANLWLAIYKTVSLFLVSATFDQMPVHWSLAVAVYLAPAALAGSLLWGLIRQSREWLGSEWIHVFVRKHVIVAGTSIAARYFIQSKKDPKNKTVVVWIIPLAARVPDSFGKVQGLYVIKGSFYETRTWKHAGMAFASKVLVFPESDSDIAEIAGSMRKVIKPSRPRKSILDVTFMLDDSEAHWFYAERKAVLGKPGEGLHFATASLAHTAAAVLALEVAPHNGLEPADLDKRTAHIVIEGWNTFAKALLIEAGQLYHYPSQGLTRVSIVCTDAVALERELSLIPGINEVLAIEVLDLVTVRRKLKNSDGSLWESPPDRIIIFSDRLWIAPEAARVWRRHFVLWGNGCIYPLIDAIIPASAIPDDLVPMIEDHSLFKDLGLSVHCIEEKYNWTELITRAGLIEMIAKGIFSQYDKANSNKPKWDVIPESEKEQNRRSARHLLIKFWYLNLKLEQGENGDSVPESDERRKLVIARMEHERWMAEKRLGDFVSGPVHDDTIAKSYIKNVLRVNSNILPFDELNDNEKMKDYDTFMNFRGFIADADVKWKLVKIRT